MSYLKFTNFFFFLLIFSLFFNCKKEKETIKYSTIDYLEVSIIQDGLNKLLQKDFYSNWLKYSTFSDSSGAKKLVFVGCSHVQDTAHPQFKIMKKLFAEIQPEIAFNEGGNWRIKGKYKAENEAITNSGEVGLMQYFCDKSNIEMENGDMTEKEDYQKMFAKFPFEKVYLLYAIERFLNPYRQGTYNDRTIEKAFFEEFIQKKMIKYGIKLEKNQADFVYFKTIYEKHFSRKFSLDNLEPVWDFYLSNKGEFGKIHRHSKEIRDSVLVSRIDSALNVHDRVFVAFGASHLQALKPALKQVLNRERK